MRHLFAIMTLTLLFVSSLAVAVDEDPYLWLEEIEAEKALDWVTAKSQSTTEELESVPEFGSIHETLLEIYNSKDRIPLPAIRGEWLYNFWQDADHVRGIWRRASLEEYVKESPAWEILLDLDALAEAEGENWVWKGSTFLPPEYRLCMLTLSRGGGDAAVRREFDTVAKAFVDGGFLLPEAKAQASWKDENTLWIGTDFGEGTMTRSSPS